MRLPVLLLAAALPLACAKPPPAALPEVPRTHGLGALAPVFDDYRVGAYRRGGGACTPADEAPRYVESLEYFDRPPVVFAVDAAGCVSAIRAEAGTTQFEHAVALATQRLGPPDGEDRPTCPATGAAIACVYWRRAEGRFEVVGAGAAAPPEFVLRAADAPLAYPWLCAGDLAR
jgi:hypothetical protein